MAQNLVQKIIANHLVSGEMKPGKEVALHIDQTLTQVAMGGGPFYMVMPEVWLVHLVGKRQPWVAAKDIIFELLRRLSVKGGVGKIIEYGGPGVADLAVPERGTITNMGAELGATTSVFPSDHRTKEYMD